MIVGPERPSARKVRSRADQFRDLTDVSKVVQSPFVQHLSKRDFSDLLVQSLPRTTLCRKIA